MMFTRSSVTILHSDVCIFHRVCFLQNYCDWGCLVKQKKGPATDEDVSRFFSWCAEQKIVHNVQEILRMMVKCNSSWDSVVLLLYSPFMSLPDDVVRSIFLLVLDSLLHISISFNKLWQVCKRYVSYC